MSEKPVNRTRRFIYIALVTAACLASALAIVFCGYDSRLAERVAEGMLDIVQIVVLSYVTASVTDRSGLLGKVGDAFLAKRAPKPADPA